MARKWRLAFSRALRGPARDARKTSRRCEVPSRVALGPSACFRKPRGPRQAGSPPVEPGFRSLKLRNMDHVLSKQSFAELIGVTPARLSQYLAEGRISGEAIVGVGRHARINVAVAQAQLKTRLDITQRIANGRARLDGAGAAAIEDDIKAERLAQLRHLNQRAAEEAALRAGAYVKAADVRQQFGRYRRPADVDVRGVVHADRQRDRQRATRRPLATSCARCARHGARSALRRPRRRARRRSPLPPMIDEGAEMLLANPERLAVETVAAALEPPPALDLLGLGRAQHRVR